MNDLGNYGAGAVTLGVGLYAAARFGRGTGLNGFEIIGLGGSLDYPWFPNTSEAVTLANGDAAVLVNDNGKIEVLTGSDGEFDYTNASNEKYWEVARQMDYFKRALRSYGRTKLSHSIDQEDLVIQLQAHADILVAQRNAREILIEDASGSTGVARQVTLDVLPYYAIRTINFHTRIRDTLTV